MSLKSLIRVEVQNIEGVQTALLVHGHKAQVALRRTINKTVGWTRSRGARLIAQEHGVPLKVMIGKGRHRRVRTFPATGDNLSGLVWFGLAPLKASYLGTPRQTRLGVKVGNRFFEGAFVADVKTGVASAYRRLGESVPSGIKGSTHTGIFKRVGRSRLPIKEQYVYLGASQQGLQQLARQVPGHLRTVFKQELNYEVNVRGRT